MKPAWILAHGLGGRTDLPLPAWMFGYGAAAALLVSFAALALFWPTARLEHGRGGRSLAAAGGPALRVLGALVRVTGLAVFVLVMVAAAVGDNSSRTNLAPVMVYVVLWVGVMLVSGLVGDVWSLLSPFDTLAAVGQRLRRRRGSRPAESAESADEASADWGYWPGAAGLLVFVWVELAYPDRAVPRSLLVLMAAYSVAVLAGAARWGRAWLRQGEAFAALFGVIAHAAPLYRAGDGRLRVRPPFVRLAGLEWRPGLEAVVLVALGSTSFDGLSRTGFWLELTGGLSGHVAVLASTAGLMWAIGTVTVAYVAAMRLAARLVDDRLSPEDLRAAFVHSLVPIALAYAVAHYFSLLVLEGQASLALASDPLGRGWDLFGTAGWVVNFNLVSPRTVAYVQCGSIVVGHVAGVVLAHDRALVLFDKRVATRSQYPLLAVMVLFTVGGLYLLLGG
ncbi:MAG: hypothetical protein ACRDZW_02860 [Acidimicrobiales bacterium]